MLCNCARTGARKLPESPSGLCSSCKLKHPLWWSSNHGPVRPLWAALFTNDVSIVDQKKVSAGS
jgi:hypothetical protein